MDATKTPQAAEPLPGARPTDAAKLKPKAKGQGKGKLLIIVALAVVVLGGGGAAAYWMWGGGRTAANAEATAEGASESDGNTAANKRTSENPGLVDFPGFLVNLADAGGQAYLRVTLGLLVADEEQSKLVAEKPALKSLLRSSILEVLSVQTGTVLVTPEGKAALKRAIIEKINSLEKNVEVEDVLFSDFVVQY